MTKKQLADIELIFRSRGIPLKPGMSMQQIEQAEQNYSLRFPPDLAELLACFVPGGKGYCDWADQSRGNVAAIQNMLDQPVEGILFDVKHNHFWMTEWGERPVRIAEALRTAKEQLRDIPKLIPIYGHRFLPSDPCEAGNPILSVHQTDIIYYGANLYDYFTVEPGGKDYSTIPFDQIKTALPFWGYFVEEEYENEL